MNPHYHHPPYPNLSSPHSPNSDGMPSSYRGHTPTGGPPNGHIIGPHHEHLHPHPAYVGGGALNQLNHHGNMPHSLDNYHHHHHYHHFLNNNDNSNSGNNNNNGSGHQNGMNVCAGCHNKILDRYLLKMMDQTWHHHCLKCSVCNCTLADVSKSCFTKDNMILCRRDYLQMFGSKAECSACGQSIAATELVQRAGGPSFPSSPVNARLPFVFHVSCFMCCKCNNKLAVGDRYCLLSNGGLVCEKDWQSMYKGSTMVTGQQTTTGTTVRKGKVGRPRRSRD